MREGAVNLLADFGQLAALLDDQLANGSYSDAFLFAAGMNQILEDHLHRETLPLSRLLPRLAALPSPLGRTLPGAAQGAGLIGSSVRSRSKKQRDLSELQPVLGGLVQDLAVAMIEESSGVGDQSSSGLGRPPDRARERARMRQNATRLLVRVWETDPEVCRLVAKHPTSFRSLDQRPADLERIIQRFGERHPDRTRPLLLVGIRTSGSYLAPLYRAYLLSSGYRDVDVITIRPQRPMLAWERHSVQRLADGDGMVLIADDPPKSGATLRDCVEGFESMGVSRDSIVLLLPLVGDPGTAPGWLSSSSAVLLPFGEWTIHEQLTSPHLLATLRELLVGRTIHLSPPGGGTDRITVGEVTSAVPVPLPPLQDLRIGSPVRRHLRARVQTQLRESGGDRHFDHDVYVKGVGFGYFGRHSSVVASSLAGFLPELYGVRDGLLFRSWMPEECRVDGIDDLDGLAPRIGSYVAARSRALAVEEDLSRRTGDVREQIAKLIEPSFGRLAMAFRPLLMALTEQLLRVDKPSVIDGSMSLSQWFRTPSLAPGAARHMKVDYDERAFANQDAVVDELHCYDAVYDLAGAAVDHAISYPEDSVEPTFEDRLRSSFEAGAARPVRAERWLLYQLMHATTYIAFLEEYLRESRGDPDLAARTTLNREQVSSVADTARRAMARSEQRYLAGLLLAGVSIPSDGPLCAVDIDGVLETSTLGYSSCTPLGVLCLRALARHGYRTVLVTGRSLGEVRDRCAAFGLPGGVAEYGAVVYNHARQQAVELLREDEREALGRLRQALERTPGVHVHSGYQRAVRASIVHSSGRQEPLPRHLASALLAHLQLDTSLETYPGFAQTDFMVSRIDKALGLAALVEQLPGTADPLAKKPLAFAIGDSRSDMPLLMLAGRAFAPRNADSELRDAGVEVMPGECQVGLAQAVANLLGHQPGGCPRCAGPQLGGDAELLLGVLSAQNAIRWAKLPRAAGLARRLLRTERAGAWLVDSHPES
jgi:hydroxymethylpyrimidine pyrophosphatase-like HAD family hydrolase